MNQTPPPIPPAAVEPPPLPDMPGGKKKTLRIAIVVIITCAALLVLALLVSTLLPGLSDAKEQAKRVVCTVNLKGISLGILRYTTENEDVYPPDIESIVNDYMDGDTTLLKCPSAKSNRNCDYFYSPPAKKTFDVVNLQNTIMVCDFKGNHSGKGRNVLFTVGRVQWMTEDEFQAALQQTCNAMFAKALREVEGF